MKINQKTLTGHLVTLRPLAEGDLPLIRQWRNSDHVRLWMFNQHRIAPTEHQNWFKRLMKDASQRYYLIETRADKRPVGAIYLTEIEPEHGRAVWGFFIGDPQDRLTGYAAEAALLVFRYAFVTLKLHRLSARIFAKNEAVISFQKHFGGVTEGVLRGHHRVNDDFADVVLTGILKPDFEAREKSIEALLSRFQES